MHEDDNDRSCWAKVIRSPGRPRIVSGVTKGRIVGIAESSLPLVELGGGSAVAARMIEPAPIWVLEAFVVSCAEVLITFEDGDRNRPVVASDLWLGERERRGYRMTSECLPFPESIVVDGRRVDVKGEEVTVRSGGQSITLRRNRKAIARVTSVTSLQIDSVDAEFFRGIDIRLGE